MLTVVQRLALAVQHHGAGRRREAEALYRGVLDEVPQHPHALHLLGVLAHQAGRHQEAIDLITRALAVQGPHPAFHSNLAAVYLITGQLALAAAHCREAIRLQPDLADAHNNLGVALRRLGQLDEAEARLPGSHPPQPQSPRRPDQPRRRPAKTGPSARGAGPPSGVRAASAGACPGPERPGRGPARQQRARGGGRPFPGSHPHPAGVCRGLRQPRPGIARPEPARRGHGLLPGTLAINPNYSLRATNLGYAYKSLGKIDEAWAEFLETLRLEPNNAMALASLSKLAETGRHPLAPDHVHKLQALLQAPGPAARRTLSAPLRPRLGVRQGGR